MANYQILKADIDGKIYENAQQKITGENLNSILNAMVATLGAEYQFAGVATIDTNPENPDAKVFYIANGKGTYTNFGSLEVTEDEVVVLYWDTEWHKVATGIASQAKLTELESEVNLHEADLNLNVFGSARHELDTKYNASQETSVVIFKNLNLKRDNTISITGILSAENMASAYINIKDSEGNILHNVIFVNKGSTTGSIIPYTPTQDYNNVSIVLACNTTASWEITATVVDYIEKDVNANKTNIATETERAEEAENTLQANIDTVSAEVRNLDKVVDYVSSEIDSGHINTGAIYYYDGQVLNYTNYFYTEPIHLSQGDKVYTTAALIANTNVAVLSIVESDGTWIRTIQILSDGLLEYTANKDCYIVISAPNAHLAYFRILTSSISKEIVKINNINSYLGMSAIFIDANSLVAGSFRKALDGEITSLKGYSYSQPIQVHKGDTLIKNNITIGSVIAFITRVDSQGNVLEVLKVGTDSAHNYYEIFDFNGYISISGITNSLIDTIILSSGLITQISSKRGVTVDNTDKLVSVELNRLSPLLRECGYGCLIKQWGFIGDSYTSGATPAYLDGELKPIDMYKWSWGQQFMKIIGAEGYNFSNGGQTAKGWLSNQGTVHDDTYVGGVGGGDWRLAQTELKHGYIISLGINDKGKFGKDYLGAVYSLGDVDTDVDVSDYMNNNENTYAGCYAGIIQRILSVQPKAKIFCMTQFQDALEDVNNVVRGIVSKLNSNNVFLLDMHEYAMDITQISGYMSNGHPSAYGYAYMAALINTYIDYIIRNNKSKFLDVTLIGTNYSLT